MASFLLEIVTPQRVELSREVETITAPGSEGEFGVLPEHTFMFTPLNIGEIIYTTGGESTSLLTGKGYAEVTPTKTTILVESSEATKDINLDEAKNALASAEEDIKSLKDGDAGYDEKRAAIEMAALRVTVTERSKG